MSKVTVYDKSGQPYTVSQVEAQAMLDSGAYFETKGVARMPATKSSLVTIYDVKTGKSMQRRPIDAKELVKSGNYTFTATKKRMQGASDSPSKAALNAPVSHPSGALPVLTEEASKEEIMAVLGQYGIQHQANMSKTDLLNLWQTYVLERGQA